MKGQNNVLQLREDITFEKLFLNVLKMIPDGGSEHVPWGDIGVLLGTLYDFANCLFLIILGNTMRLLISKIIHLAIIILHITLSS